MIARHWRGWTEPQDADAYETLLKDTVSLASGASKVIEADTSFAETNRRRSSSW